MNFNYRGEFSKFVGSSSKVDYLNKALTAKVNQLPIENYTTPYILEERQLNVAQMDVFSRLMQDRVLFFNEDVNDYNMGILCAQVMFLSNLDKDAPIKMYINSPGGGVIAGLSLYDTIMSSTPRFSTTIMGMGASMGSILGTIKKLHKDDPQDLKTRFMMKHSRLMIHDIRGGTQGTYKDQQISLDLTKELRTELFQILSNHSGQTIETIADLCDRDKWMKIDEAVELGFIDGGVNYQS